METVKRIGVLLLVGAACGNAVATLIGPGMVSWYNLGSDPTANCNCVQLTHNVTTALVRAQLIGTAIGAVVFLVVGIFISRAMASRKSASGQTPPASKPGV